MYDIFSKLGYTYCFRASKLALRDLIKSFNILYSFHFTDTFNVAFLLFALLSNYVPSNRFLARPKVAIYVSWEIKFVLRGKVIHYSVSCMIFWTNVTRLWMWPTSTNNEILSSEVYMMYIFQRATKIFMFLAKTGHISIQQIKPNEQQSK